MTPRRSTGRDLFRDDSVSDDVARSCPQTCDMAGGGALGTTICVLDWGNAIVNYPTMLITSGRYWLRQRIRRRSQPRKLNIEVMKVTALDNVRMAPEYDCYPLWAWRQDDLENLAPNSLPVSPELRKDIELWDAEYQASYATEYPPDSGFATSAEEADFAARGEKLARRLKRELGATVEVTYRDLRTPGRVRITE